MKIDWDRLRRVAISTQEADQIANEIVRLQHDAKLGQELEAAVCMHTHFTGDPPYVGTEGLVLAIKEQATALRRIARGDYDSLSGNPTKWPGIIAYKALGGRHKDGVALDRELLGESSSVKDTQEADHDSG